MARRLSCDERALIEAMRAAGVSVDETARRRSRVPSTVCRELAPGGYDAEAVVERRVGGVESVRGLLDDSGTALDTALAATLSSAYTWSLGALAAISARSVPTPLRLYASYNPDRFTRD